MLDDDAFVYELAASDDCCEYIIKVTGPPMTDVEFVAALKCFCEDAEKNICDDGETIAFDADDGADRH